MPITQSDVDYFISQLDPEIHKIYNLAFSFCESNDDTLDTNWQVASEILEVFKRQTEIHLL